MKFNVVKTTCEAASIICYILLIFLFGGTWQTIIFKIIMLPLCVMSGLYLQYFKNLPHYSNIYYVAKIDFKFTFSYMCTLYFYMESTYVC